MSKDDDDARQLILARRQFFIASALAGVSLTACDRQPQPCLDISTVPIDPVPVDSSTPTATTASAHPSTAPTVCLDMPAEPHVCLEMAMPEPSTSASAPKPAPRVCLRKVMPPAPPRVCLSDVDLDD